METDNISRLRINIHGAVQGVGFRPFIYRLATDLSLVGYVNNSSNGVSIELEGSLDLLNQFKLRLQQESPPRASIHSMEVLFLPVCGWYKDFKIIESQDGKKTTLVVPDIATCSDCKTEIFDPNNRRYLYPFTNCTNCGPRYSIIERLPYDRQNTSMSGFKMCEKCQQEYDDPENRRFHAQPNACPDCGPQCVLSDTSGGFVSAGEEVFKDAVLSLVEGSILALKGLGGYHFMVDARNTKSIQRLREKKLRDLKPFALMYDNVEAIKQDCYVSDEEERLLKSPEAPIVLLRKKENSLISEAVAPGNPFLGVMLPYTPLHMIIMHYADFPIVATSANIKDEPMCYKDTDAIDDLSWIADLMLMHDRPIVRRVDDSIVRIVMGREMVLRRARGYAPLPINVTFEAKGMIAYGAHLKNTVSVAMKNNILLSQYIGDLNTERAFNSFINTSSDLLDMYEINPQKTICDMHPDYSSSNYARETPRNLLEVQHHYAHVLSCMAENQIDAPVLGVAFDGTGFGIDGTIWGGEFLAINEKSFDRIAYFKPFALPGGNLAVQQAWRSALGLSYSLLGRRGLNKGLFFLKGVSEKDVANIKKMMDKKINSPFTSSCGRIFDAFSALAGICMENEYEGQAAMALEFAIGSFESDDSYNFALKKVAGALEIDLSKALHELFKDNESRVSVQEKAIKFHNMLSEIVVVVALRSGLAKVALSGGCFQNEYLLKRVVNDLKLNGIDVYWHQRVPTNDGGISLGQIFAAQRQSG